jgi:phosphoribosylanthranilate isomerase
MLGFNFYASSPRFVDVRAARRIIARLPKRVQSVGVFVDDDPQDMDDIGRLARLDFIQAHGGESPRTVAALAESYGVIKAFRVRRGFRVARLARFADAAALMLDGFQAKLRGGTGRAFDWKVAVAAKEYGSIFLAGGLKAENVADAIRMVRPYAVDVASGVESEPGIKDTRKMKEFFQAVESANR